MLSSALPIVLVVLGGGPVQQNPCPGWLTPAFFEAADSTAVVRCLNGGADDGGPRTPNRSRALHLAAAHSQDAAVLRILIQRDSLALEARTLNGRTPLHVAARLDRDSVIIRTLLEGGASPMAKNGDPDRTPLHLAAYFGSIKAARAIVSSDGCSREKCVNEQDSAGNTPLHDVARTDQGEKPGLARVLEDAGAKCSIMNNKGDTPQEIAAREGNELVWQALDTACYKAWKDPQWVGIVASLLLGGLALSLQLLGRRSALAKRRPLAVRG